MRDYRSRAVDRLFIKNTPQLKNNVNKLIQHTGYYTGSRDEVWQEMCMLFYKNFEDKYETDRQYLSFLFICLKNRIRNMQKKQYTRENRFIMDLGTLGNVVGARRNEGSELNYNAVWGQVKDPSSHWGEYEVSELIQNYRKMLDKVGAQVFDAMLTESHISTEVDELIALKRRGRWRTPAEKRRLNILQNTVYVEGLEMSEVVLIIKKQIRPLFEAQKISHSL